MESRSMQKRKAMQRGEPMPTFDKQPMNEQQIVDELVGFLDDCGELLVCAYQARVDGDIISDELRCYIENHSVCILSHPSIRAAIPPSKREWCGQVIKRRGRVIKPSDYLKECKDGV